MHITETDDEYTEFNPNGYYTEVSGPWGAEVRSNDPTSFRERQEELGKYLAEAARWEIGRTTGIGTAINGAFSLVGTGASVIAAFASKQLMALPAGDIAMILFGAAANAMFLALVMILLTLRAVPTKWHRKRPLTGWPTLTNPSRGDRIARFRQSARALGAFYREDATTLAQIANRKHGRMRIANTFAIIGTLAFAGGVDVLLTSLLG